MLKKIVSLKQYCNIIIFIYLLVYSNLFCLTNAIFKHVTITGIIKDNLTQKPIYNAHITLLASDVETFSDKKGYYSIQIPYLTQDTVVIKTKEYFSEIKILNFDTQPNYNLDIYLVSKLHQLQPIIVKGKKEETLPMGRIKLFQEDFFRIPGINSDILRSVQIFPGVVFMMDYLGLFSIRGSGIFDNRIEIDKIPVLFPFHFGGLISIFNNEFVKDSELFAGGYSSQYGDVTGGIFKINAYNQIDTPKFNISISPLFTEIFIQDKSEISDNYSISMMLGGRYSYIEYIMKGFFPDLTVIPQFYDYQSKIYVNLNDWGDISMMFFGSRDTVHSELTELDDIIKDLVLKSLKPYSHHFNNGGIRSRLYPNKNLDLEFGYQFENSYTNMDIGSSLFNIGFSPRVRTYYTDITWSNKYFKMLSGLSISDNTVDILQELGWYGIIVWSDTESVTSIPHDRRETINYKKIETYLSFEKEMYNFTINAGLRYNRHTGINRYNLVPRFSLVYNLKSFGECYTAIGNYYQSPQPYEYYMGEPSLKYTESRHYVLGYKNSINDNSLFKIEGYYKSLNNIIEFKNNFYNIGTKYIMFSNQLQGYSYGIELYLKYKYKESLLSILSYSYSKSERSFINSDEIFNYKFDQPHILTCVLSYKFTKTFQVGLKWRLNSGLPYTIDDKNLYSERTPMYHRLDLRIDKKFNIDKIPILLYLEILNVYNRENVIKTIPVAGLDYENVDLKNLPILPYLGVKVEF